MHENVSRMDETEDASPAFISIGRIAKAILEAYKGRAPFVALCLIPGTTNTVSVTSLAKN